MLSMGQREGWWRGREREREGEGAGGDLKRREGGTWRVEDLDGRREEGRDCGEGGRAWEGTERGGTEGRREGLGGEEGWKGRRWGGEWGRERGME